MTGPVDYVRLTQLAAEAAEADERQTSTITIPTDEYEAFRRAVSPDVVTRLLGELVAVRQENEQLRADVRQAAGPTALADGSPDLNYWRLNYMASVEVGDEKVAELRVVREQLAEREKCCAAHEQDVTSWAEEQASLTAEIVALRERYADLSERSETHLAGLVVLLDENTELRGFVEAWRQAREQLAAIRELVEKKRAEVVRARDAWEAQAELLRDARDLLIRIRGMHLEAAASILPQRCKSCDESWPCATAVALGAAVLPEPATKPAAELLRQIARDDPEGHSRRLARAYGAGPATCEHGSYNRHTYCPHNAFGATCSEWSQCPGPRVEPVTKEQ